MQALLGEMGLVYRVRESHGRRCWSAGVPARNDQNARRTLMQITHVTGWGAGNNGNKGGADGIRGGRSWVEIGGVR